MKLIETTLRDYLINAQNMPVYLSVPADHPDTYVVLERTGGGRSNRLPSATFAIQSCAPSMQEAAELNEVIKVLMEGFEQLPEIGSARLDSDYNFTDTSKKGFRYQAVYDIVYGF